MATKQSGTGQNNVGQVVASGTTPAASNAASAAPGTAVGSNGATPHNLGKLRARLSAMAQGWSTAMPAGSALPALGGNYSSSSVVTEINGWLPLFPAVDAAKLGYATAVAQLHDAEPAMRVKLAKLELALRAFFGKSSPLLAQFGMKPAKLPAKLSAAKLAVRVERSKQTRAIRKTLGSKQKADLKFRGELTTQVVGPATEAQAPATAAPTPPVSPTGK